MIRSNKNIKAEAFNQLLTNEEMPPCGSLPEPVSFKEKLMGKNFGDIHEEMDDLLSDEDDGDEPEEKDESDYSSIKLIKTEKARLRKPWKQMPIIKILGRRIGYTLLLRKINELWRPKAMVDLVALDDDFFLAKFSAVDDYEYAMLRGPWMIFNHYLMVRQWHHNFDPNQSSLQSLLVWVRIPYLLIEYFNYKFLMTVGSKIGKPVRIDDATSIVSRGHYARICMEMDLLKPLVINFKLRRKVRKLEYEGFHLVYFGCVLYGHRKKSCPHEKKEPPIAQEPTAGEETILKMERQDEGETNGVEAAINLEVTDMFGL